MNSTLIPAGADEIDLVELLKSLWQQKLLIIAFTVAATLVAIAFVYLSAPEYEAKSSVLPPRLSDIAGYNLGRAEVNLDAFKVADVYAVFKTNLLSGASKLSFFRDIYIPSLAADKAGSAQDMLWKEFNKTLTVRAADIRNNPDLYEVSVAHESPQLAAGWVNTYVAMAAKKTEEEMQGNVLTEIAAKIQVLEKQIDAARITEGKRREDRIARLREALVVAEAVGFDAPQVVAGKTSSNGDLAQFVDGNLMYMRGAKAVRAELSVLEERQNDDPFINGLRDIEKQLDFLKKIDVNPDNVAVYTLDSVAEVPVTPLKPKKLLSIALGIVLGGMLGVFVALIRILLNKRNLQLS